MANRHLNISLILPLVLAFCIGILVYLYGTSKAQYNSTAHELKELQKVIANVRSEKESLQYELNKKKDEFVRVSKDRNDALERESNLEGKAKQLELELNQIQVNVHEERKKAKEEADVLQGDRDTAKSDLNTYIQKWKQCESDKKEADKQAKLRASETQKELNTLKHDAEVLRAAKTDVERRLNEMEQELRVCQSQQRSHDTHGAGEAVNKPHPLKEQVAVDDRSIELLPPDAAHVARQHHPSNDVRREGAGQPNPQLLDNNQLHNVQHHQ